VRVNQGLMCHTILSHEGLRDVTGLSADSGTEFFEDCTYFENNIMPDNMPALLYAIKG
jgi:hypothetical protein